ncbi:hypothetical protein [Stratiformator vulcanicus]|uniref:Uncharacterized protein n=1 Tax=Stratiformator vulcanicus TaxID=2527980 RepID=A0A517R3E0_9PLAN|nr:hypothetical protein [Stratiformator vulcanicus]QDT38415.1 hypothetical protein Pan189_28090 [Stratiformator vulcanicus]
MKVFRELFVEATREQMDEAVSQMTQSSAAHWSRDKEAETRVSTMSAGSTRRKYCFRCNTGTSLPGALLFLTEKGEQLFYVSNVIPTESGGFDVAEYNNLLLDFYNQVFRPAAHNLQHRLTEADVDLNEWMSESTQSLLAAFSDCANKSTGAAHPNDRARWLAFVVKAHEENCTLEAADLKRWLIEEGGWGEEIAAELAMEYSIAREVLGFAQTADVA